MACPADPDDEPAPGEGGQKCNAGGNAEHRGGGLVLLGAHDGAAKARTQQPVGGNDNQYHDHQEDIELARGAIELPAEDAGRGYGKTSPASGQATHLDIPPDRKSAVKGKNVAGRV